MSSWKDEIVDPQNTTISQFGGITINKILQYFKATDLTNGGSSPGENADIATETIFASGILKLWDSNKSHKISFTTPDYTETKTWTFPNETAMGASDEFVFKDSVAILTNKVIDFSLNTASNIPSSAIPNTVLRNDLDNSLGDHYLDIGDIAVPSNPASGTVRIFFDTATSELSVRKSGGTTVSLESGGGGPGGSGGFVAGGIETFSGDGVETEFRIPHTMSPQPDAVNVLPNSVDALGSYIIAIDTDDIVITYSLPPPDDVGTIGNVEFLWSAGYINESTSGFSPTTFDTIQNKTINVDQNTIKNSTTNNSGDILVSDGTGYRRFPRGTANQTLVMNSTGSNVQWTSSTGGGSGGGALSAGGPATFSGDGTTAVFNIAHGLITPPESFFVLPTSNDARGNYIIGLSGGNIVITYSVAPPTGSSNLTFIWGAGYVAQAIQGFTPGSTTTITNKTIGDFLGFTKQGSTPTNPALEGAILYTKAIDADNNGLFMKIKKGAAIVEVQIL